MSRGLEYKVGPIRIIKHRFRMDKMFLLVEWAQDIPPEWETQDWLTANHLSSFKAALAKYRFDEPRKFTSLIQYPGILDVYRY